MPPCASDCNIGTRGGGVADVADTTGSARDMRLGRLERGYIFSKQKATVQEGSSMASCSKRQIIDCSI